MKRRNVDCSKPRRPLKRSKITEGIYGSTFLYLKFLMVWALVLMADFILEFRFEYLWPFWLLIRSVYDSFKYQGLAFSVFFVCIAVTSDMICYLFIPVQWLFFAASTYVWVQYVWHTERGICLPTVSLWLLFVYIEASVRLREFKSLPFYLDLCRPFAAHCIGYPVVTLGFGFKSYISYRLRLRKQKDVQKDNEFYMQLLQQALPAEQQLALAAEKQKALPSKPEEVISNGVSPTAPSSPTSVTAATTNSVCSNSGSSSSRKSGGSTKSETPPPPPSSTSSSNSAPSPSPAPDKDRDKDKAEREKEKELKKSNNSSSLSTATTSPHIEDYQYIEREVQKRNSINNYAEENLANEQNAKTYKQANGVTKTAKLNSQKDQVTAKKGRPNNTATVVPNNNKDESIGRLESDIKRLKADLQSSRNTEQELRSQINNLVVGDKSVKSELFQLRADNESLQTKLHNLVTSRQQDKQTLASLERKLQEERKQRSTLEKQMTQERAAKRAEEAAAARAVAMATANSSRGECTENCKMRRRDLENEMKMAKRDAKMRDDQIKLLERETQTLQQYKEAQTDTEVLMSALAAMQDKNTHLENSLSAETRLKLDLFSALGEAKRQVEIQQGLMVQKEMEINEYKSKIAELLAVNPATSSFTPVSSDNSPHFSANFAPALPSMPSENELLSKSSLNPHATDYTPKLSQ